MTSHPASLPADQEQLLLNAAAWRLLGLLFECPSAEWYAQVARLGSESRDPQLRAAAEAAQSEASEGLHHSLFGPGGPVSPREVTYLGGVQSGYLLAELNAYYEAFAYRPESLEPEDHLSVESGFMAYLALKQAYALASGNAEHASVTAEAAARFATDHLAGMVEPIAKALVIGGPPYLALAGRALLDRVGPAPCRHLPMADACGEDTDEGLTCGTT